MTRFRSVMLQVAVLATVAVPAFWYIDAAHAYVTIRGLATSSSFDQLALRISLENAVFWAVASFTWLLAVLLIASGIQRRRRSDEAGPGMSPRFCPACDYDLTNNESGVCPECGRAIGS